MSNSKSRISNGVNLYNTLTRKKENFKPLQAGRAGIYSCGPTVYDYAHIGNMRAYIFADVLKRVLSHSGYKVKHIVNITDVGHLAGDRDMGEDKMLASAKKAKKTAWQIASYYTDAFLKDMESLNIKPPSKLPKATEHVKDMIRLVKILEDKGFTYRTSDGIYFDTAKLPNYGKLARLDIKGLKEGARVEINPEKKNPTDFALWKLSVPKGARPERSEGSRRDMEWDSPWGPGFPGWHIECSAMSLKYLGAPFDIHTGGIDFIPIHHTNELAQTEGAYGKLQANYWLHSEFITVDKKRMGKSEGNLITLDELVSRGYPPLVYRYFVLQGHYRSKLNFTWEAMDSAQNALNSLYSRLAEYGKGKIVCAEYQEDFFAALDDDLDTPRALAVMWKMIGSDQPSEAKFASLMEFDRILGLDLGSMWEKLQKSVPKNIEKLVKKREELREQKKWDEADKIREEIENSGYEVSDSNEGAQVRPKLFK